MKMNKKLLAIFMSAVMLFTAVPITAYAAAKAPSKPTSVSAVSTNSTVTVKWKKVSGATGYTVYKYNTSAKKYSKVASTKNTSCKISKLKAGTTYVYAVKAYKTVKKKNYYSSYSSKVTVSTLPANVTGLKKTAATTSTVSLAWSKVSGATGYTVYSYNTSTKKYTKIASTKNLSYKVSSLKAGTAYVYSVRAYRTVSSKTYYSGYSSRVTLSTLPAKPTGLKKTAAATDSISVSWTKVTGATGYKLQYSTSKTFSSGVKTVTQTGVSKTVTSLNPDTTYYFRVYAYRTVSGTTYTSAVSSVVSAATLELHTDTKSQIDESTTYQTIDGFGASGAWWAQKVGGWENAEDFIKLLYSKDEGIGLNIFRYNLGAGTDTDEYIDHGKSAQSFIGSIDGTRNSDGVWSDYTINYDWSKDENAQKALAIARDCFGDDLRVVLFSNSPPVEMTINGKGYCSFSKGIEWLEDGSYTVLENYNRNLNVDNYAMFADYVTTCADHFVEQGYNVVDVSPVNEPQYSWACNAEGYTSQEGCYYSPSDLRRLLSRMATTAKDKPYKISMFESCGVSGVLWNPEYVWQDCFRTYYPNIIDNNNTNESYYTAVSVHSYWNNKADKAEFASYMNQNYPGISIACTEYCQMTNDVNTGVYDLQQTLSGFEYNGVTIEFGVQLARTIFEDLTVLNATEWNWWTAVSGGYYPDGLVYYDAPAVGEAVWDSTAKTVYTTKRLWCMGNFSKFIEEGAVRVKITEAQSDLLSCAFKNPDGSLAVVYINQTDNDMTTNVKASGYNSYETYVTSAEKDLELNQSGSYSYNNGISVPSQSVVTVVLK